MSSSPNEGGLKKETDMKVIADQSIVQAASHSLVEFLLGDGVRLGWLDTYCRTSSAKSRYVVGGKDPECGSALLPQHPAV